MKKLAILSSVALVVGMFASSASACWDNTDLLVKKLQKLELTTEQLKDVFQYQKQHRDFVTMCHSEGKGCRVHENHEVEFQKNAYGVLTDDQFQKVVGRERTEVEKLRFENYKLKKENERLKKQLEQAKAEQNG